MAGRTWLFTLATKGTSSPGGTKLAEIGPIPVGTAPEFLLRVLNVSGPRGASTGVHLHPGTEAFYVITGQLTQKTQHGVSTVDPGSSMPGHDGNTVMEVSSSGIDNLNAVVLSIVDAEKQFFVPAKFY